MCDLGSLRWRLITGTFWHLKKETSQTVKLKKLDAKLILQLGHVELRLNRMQLVAGLHVQFGFRDPELSQSEDAFWAGS